VTTLFIEGTPNVFDSHLDVQSRDLLVLAENIILMRYQQVDARLRRLLSFVKLRDSAYDDAVREVSITARGMEVSDPFLTVGAATAHAVKLPSKKRKPASPRRPRR
jgi:circadian clock protein KaiC